jgi:hypothetical protein
LDGAGKPVPGAEVSLSRALKGNREGGVGLGEFYFWMDVADAAVARKIANADGRFAFREDEAPTGWYDLRAGSAGFGTAMHRELRVEAGGSVEIRLGPACRQAGWVDLGAGAPAQEVSVVAVGTPQGAPPAESVKFRTPMRPDGAFAFEDLVPGTYRFLARVPGRGLAQELDVRVPSGRDLLLVPEGGFAVSGCVFDRFTGKPLAGARVVADSFEGNAFGAARAEPGGKYRIPDLPRLEYSVSASAPGYMSACVEIDGISASEAVRDFRLTRGTAVSGVVVDAATGSPVPGVRVRSGGFDPAFEPDPSAGATEAETGPDGAFAIPSVPLSPAGGFLMADEDGADRDESAEPWIVLLCASKDGWWETGRTRVPARLGAERVDGVRIEMAAASRARGRVVDPAGNPVSGAAVECLRLDDVRWDTERAGERKRTVAKTAADGAFDVFLKPGYRLCLWASHPEFAPEILEVRSTGPKGELDGLTLKLRIGGTVEGVVEPEDGPLPGVRVWAIRAPDPGATDVDSWWAHPFVWTSITALPTDEAGRFSTPRLPAGCWILGVHGPGRTIAEHRVQVADGTIEQVRIRVPGDAGGK